MDQAFFDGWGKVPFLAVSASEYYPAPFPSRTGIEIGPGGQDLRPV